MKMSYYLEDKSGRIAVMAFLTPDINMGEENRWILNRIAVTNGTPKDEGWGTKLLGRITTQADAERATLWLGVDPDEPKMFWPLVKWYRRYGFAPQKSRMSRVQNVMIRRPRHLSSKVNWGATMESANQSRKWWLEKLHTEYPEETKHMDLEPKTKQELMDIYKLLNK